MTIPLLTSLVTTFFRIYSIACLHQKFPSMVKVMDDADRILNYPKRFHYIERKHMLLMVITSTIFTLPYQTITVVSFVNEINFKIYFYNIYNQFSMVCVEMQLVSLCHLTRRRLKALNLGLRAIKDIVATQNTVSSFGPLDSRSVCNDTKTQIKSKMYALKLTHHQLTLVVDKIKSYFSSIILFSFIVCTVNTFMNFYFAIFNGLKGSSTNYRTSTDVYNCCYWATFYASRIIILCMYSDKMSSEVRKLISSCSFLLYRSTNVKLIIFIQIIQISSKRKLFTRILLKCYLQ